MSIDTRDKVAILHGAEIQHGDLNRRIYLMKIGSADPVRLIPALRELARECGYTKIFARLPAARAEPFIEAGYEEEARIPHYYNGAEDGLFLSLFLDPDRSRLVDREELDNVLELARARAGAGNSKALLAGAELRSCTEADADEMSRIYRKVFPSYPFPIDDPAYLLKTMRTNVAYYGVEIDGNLTALASAELDRVGSNVEMTDFATLPEWLGNGFAAHLLEFMECEMRKRNIQTACTIARAVSAGMNITFSKLGYEFGGRLKNNTNISGQIESMNIWYRPLAE